MNDIQCCIKITDSTVDSEGNVYDRLVRSIAPSIWELDDVKKGVLCQLFGGTMQSQMKHAGPADIEEAAENGHGDVSGKKDATVSHQRYA